MHEFMDSERHLLPLEPGARPGVSKMYYTQCPACGPINDWSDSYAEARRNAAGHARAHERRAYVPFPTT
jgi:hypothetical protein